VEASLGLDLFTYVKRSYHKGEKIVSRI